MKGINAAETVEYISKYETDKENPTVWILGLIDQQTRDRIDDMSTSYEVDPKAGEEGKAKAVFHFNRARTELVRAGLKGFRGFIDPKTGQEIEFKTMPTHKFGGVRQILHDEILNRIPRDVLKELADKIDALNKMTGQEEKNS